MVDDLDVHLLVLDAGIGVDPGVEHVHALVSEERPRRRGVGQPEELDVFPARPLVVEGDVGTDCACGRIDRGREERIGVVSWSA